MVIGPIPSVAVLMPLHNEEKYVERSLLSILRQTVKPRLILVGDNDSTDRSPLVVRHITSKYTDVEIYLYRIKRFPELGKLNINNVYYALHKALLPRIREFDLVATIEADTFLEHRYFEKLWKSFIRDSKLCITGGRLEPLGILEDSFPLRLRGVIPWGSNRVYRADCWAKLNDVADIRFLPAWDTDHVILALALGYHVYYTPNAVAYHLKPVTPFRGYPKGRVDAMHGLPVWWALYKTLTRRDINYLRGYVSTRISAYNLQVPEYYRVVLQTYRSRVLKTLFSKIMKF